MKQLPTPETVELTGADAWHALVEHFGVAVVDTEPMALDDLPAPLALEPINGDAHRWQRVLGDLWEQTNAR